FAARNKRAASATPGSQCWTVRPSTHTAAISPTKTPLQTTNFFVVALSRHHDFMKEKNDVIRRSHPAAAQLRPPSQTARHVSRPFRPASHTALLRDFQKSRSREHQHQ